LPASQVLQARCIDVTMNIIRQRLIASFVQQVPEYCMTHFNVSTPCHFTACTQLL
jgi:hypothetical protein